MRRMILFVYEKESESMVRSHSMLFRANKQRLVHLLDPQISDSLKLLTGLKLAEIPTLDMWSLFELSELFGKSAC